LQEHEKVRAPVEEKMIGWVFNKMVFRIGIKKCILYPLVGKHRIFVRNPNDPSSVSNLFSPWKYVCVEACILATNKIVPSEHW
jgi:hypothetical protein